MHKLESKTGSNISSEIWYASAPCKAHLSTVMLCFLSEQPYCYSSAEKQWSFRNAWRNDQQHLLSVFLLSSPLLLPWLRLVHNWPVRFIPLRTSYAHMLLQVLRRKCCDGDDGKRMWSLSTRTWGKTSLQTHTDRRAFTGSHVGARIGQGWRVGLTPLMLFICITNMLREKWALTMEVFK